MRTRKFIVWTYAAIILVGGVIGATKAHSKASLITSLIASTLLFLFAYGMKKKERLCLYGSAAVILVLDAFFTYRFLSTLHFIPSGMMSVVSFLALAALVYNLPKKRYLP